MNRRWGPFILAWHEFHTRVSQPIGQYRCTMWPACASATKRAGEAAWAPRTGRTSSGRSERLLHPAHLDYRTRAPGLQPRVLRTPHRRKTSRVGIFKGFDEVASVRGKLASAEMVCRARLLATRIANASESKPASCSESSSCRGGRMTFCSTAICWIAAMVFSLTDMDCSTYPRKFRGHDKSQKADF
jgi:hypothetical protein